MHFTDGLSLLCVWRALAFSCWLWYNGWEIWEVFVMGYKIVASDLDKTLLGPDKTVSKENWAAIAAMHERGVHFVPASGRAYEEMPRELLDSPLIRYYITSDGTTVYDKHTGITHELPMSRELAHHVLRKVFSYDVCTMVHADTRSYVDEKTHSEAAYASYNMSRSWVDFSLTMEVVVKDLERFAYELPAVQAVIPFFKNMEDLKDCMAYFQRDPRVLVAQSAEYNLEIFDASAGKGNALMLLARLLNIDPADTIAVGDSTNDYTMVKAAGLGLAVENAVPELKAVADTVICDYRRHSAKYILEHYID